MKTVESIRDKIQEQEEQYDQIGELTDSLGIDRDEIDEEREKNHQFLVIIDNTRDSVMENTGQDIFDAGVKKLSAGVAGEFHPADDDVFYDENMISENGIHEDFAHVAEHEGRHYANDNAADEPIIDTAVNETFTEVSTKETTGKQIAYKPETVDTKEMFDDAEASFQEGKNRFDKANNAWINDVIRASRNNLTLLEYQKTKTAIDDSNQQLAA